jgi:hypothetical protein
MRDVGHPVSRFLAGMTARKARADTKKKKQRQIQILPRMKERKARW